ncbi:aminotransferase class V-fold PLP-dependent enzyme [Chitinivibrio alkaliphilus]|uniref:Class V aminotransferase n=1 Tax=Chitinivibrio alkaliphilus ACht1 TaxID=1313304 RepID=U7D980_9BACT|nr:aminotransferase class V-fold PLP-dependent enzyme [Chitinivibrio alkaliphilus]ERP32141.1 class V aminotransferase [Chitinivibrio alkaliphilus ACht1]
MINNNQRVPQGGNEIFLNHAAISPIAPAVAQEAQTSLAALSRGIPDIQEWVNTLKECREETGRLINAPPESIAFTQNTSHAISLIAEGLCLDSGDEIIVSPVEYPANYYPWKNLERRGIVLRHLPEKDPSPSFEAILEAITDKTRLIALSHVQYFAGHRCAVEKLRSVCSTHTIYLCADLIQSVGVLPVDVNSLGVDFAAFGSQKWLLAPPGIGTLYIKPALLTHITPVITGAFSVQTPLETLQKDLSFAETARRFESGTMNFTLFSAYRRALRIAQEKGIAHIYASAMERRAFLYHTLKRKGYTLLSPENPAQGSPIVTFSHGTKTKSLYNFLRKKGVVATFRHNTIRFAPHYYTPWQKLKSLAKLV